MNMISIYIQQNYETLFKIKQKMHAFEQKKCILFSQLFLHCLHDGEKGSGCIDIAYSLCVLNSTALSMFHHL